jgi:hypothetical protein
MSEPTFQFRRRIAYVPAFNLSIDLDGCGDITGLSIDFGEGRMTDEEVQFCRQCCGELLAALANLRRTGRIARDVIEANQGDPQILLIMGAIAECQATVAGFCGPLEDFFAGRQKVGRRGEAKFIRGPI